MERQPDAAAGGVAGRPALARARVGGVAVGAQRAAVDPGVGQGIDHVLAASAEHRGRNRGRGDAHQQHVIEPDAIEAVLQRQHALDLVGLNHAPRERPERGCRRPWRLR